MSGSSRDYYYSSSSRGTGRTDGNRGSGQGLPRIRDVLREQFEQPYDARVSQQQSSYASRSELRLPPIRETSAPGPEDYRYRRNPQNSSSTLPPSHTQGSSYRVLALSNARGELIPVSTSYTRAPGIVREHVLTAGQDDDPRKRFECPVCGRRMERQSVYNQHMLTHTGERPHVCSYCTKTFNSKSNLNRHLLTHGRGNDTDAANKGDGASSSNGYYTSSRRA